MFNEKIKKNSTENYIFIFLLFLSILIYSFLSPDLQGGESWIYWFLNKELANGLPVFGRSPIYVVYIEFFKIFEDLNGIIIEWILTNLESEH